jgi:hypothetical protein
MKAKSLRSIEAAVLLLGGLGAVSSAPAAVINGALGNAASATDKYDFLCPLGTASVLGTVQDLLNVFAPCEPADQ